MRLHRVAAGWPGPTRRSDTGLQIIAGDVGKEGGVKNVGGVRIHQGLFVHLAGVGFRAGDEARAYMGEIRAHGLSRQYACARADSA
jgi:hypothetical protein